MWSSHDLAWFEEGACITSEPERCQAATVSFLGIQLYHDLRMISV